MAITKIHAVKVRLGDAINYIENPDKTDGQELLSGYNTAPQTAVLDFSVTAAMARKARNTSAKNTGILPTISFNPFLRMMPSHRSWPTSWVASLR